MKTTKQIMAVGKKYLPQILSFTACIGVGVVAVMSGHDTLKAKKILDEKNAEREDTQDTAELTVKEKAKAVWKCYIPTAVACGLTMGSMIASRKISSAQLASVTAACGYLALNRKNTDSELDKEQLKEADKKSAEKIISFEDAEKWAEPTGLGNELCFDAWSGRYFLSSREAVIRGLEEFTESLKKAHYASYNDLYSCLGISETYFGNEFGWAVDDGDEGYCPTCEDDIGFAYDYEEVGGRLVFMFTIESPAFYPYEGWMEY